MPSFFEIQAGSWKVKGMLASVVLVIIGLVGTVYKQTSSSGSLPPVVLKCFNDQCNHVVELSSEDFRKMQEAADADALGIDPCANNTQQPPMGPGGMMGMPGMLSRPWGQPGSPLQCPECGQDTLFVAIKCAECGEVFYRDYSVTKFGDRCPKCGYSKQEETSKRLKAERNKK